MFQQQEAFSRVCLEVEDGWLLYWFQTTRMVPVIRGYGGQQRSAGGRCQDQEARGCLGQLANDSSLLGGHAQSAHCVLKCWYRCSMTYKISGRGALLWTNFQIVLHGVNQEVMRKMQQNWLFYWWPMVSVGSQVHNYQGPLQVSSEDREH